MGNRIKFSHDYVKLHGQRRAMLLGVLPLEVGPAGLHPALREYDTRTVDGQYFPIPSGKYLQLVFLGNLRIPFCTIRPFTESKREYYQALVGERFDVVIDDDAS